MQDLEFPKITEEEKLSPRAMQNIYPIAGAIIVAGAMISVSVLYSNSLSKLSTKDKAAIGIGDREARVSGNLADDDPFLGNPSALVEVVEFSDFQCPFCRRFWQTIFPPLKKKYIDSGKVKFVYRDFPLSSIHELAQKYAEAGECADEQGKFWLMHDKIFEEQKETSAYTVGDIKSWARAIGLDGVTFDQCLDSAKYAKEVENDFLAGQAAGVSGTPATFVNGRLVAGAVPFLQIEKVIEEELKKAE